ncbi:MAG: acyltransferase [Alphaproteobacteria bacterium]|nr:acyltransferase [Alphaproteobacteria bacterium]
MIEAVRFVLSCIVLEAHIWPLGVPWLAWASVFGFYTLSGFLMVRVLTTRYGFGVRNFFCFIANRVLRLWPAYLVVLGLTAVGMTAFRLSEIYRVIQLPTQPSGVLVNLTVLGLVGLDFRHEAAMPMMVGNIWSLSVEMFCYMLLALYFAKTKSRLWALAALGAVMIAWSTANCAVQPPDAAAFYGGYCFQNRYGVLQAGFIPFALGGLLYLHAEAAARVVKLHGVAIAAALVGCLALIGAIPVLQFTLAPFFGSVLVGCAVVCGRGGARRRTIIDFFGRASYHLFIAQWIVAAALIRIMGLARDSFVLCLATLIVSLGLSFLLVPLEWRIERYRRRVAPLTVSRFAAAEPLPAQLEAN